MNRSQQRAFPKLTDEQLSALAKFTSFTSLKTYHNGEHLFKTGDRDFKFFVIEQGKVEIIESSTGKRKTVTVIATDDKGFIKTGIQLTEEDKQSYHRQLLLETSQPGIFAAGDVRSYSIKRVASAVGEGSMTVKFVHQVLSM